jgi:cytochrome P450
LAESPNTHSNELLANFNAALRGLGKRILLGRLRVLFLWDWSYDRLAHKFHAVIDQYIDKAIVRKAKPDSGGSSADTPHRYIMLDELVDVLQDRKEICNQIINILLPARDATGIGLSGVIFLVARHPQVWQKLRAEVLSISGPITYEVLKSLQYTQ